MIPDFRASHLETHKRPLLRTVSTLFYWFLIAMIFVNGPEGRDADGQTNIDSGLVITSTNRPPPYIQMYQNYPPFQINEDWQLSGGESFSIYNSGNSGTSIPFAIAAGAPMGSLSIMNDGKLIFGNGSIAPAGNVQIISPQPDASLLLSAPDPQNTQQRHQWILDCSYAGFSLGEYSNNATPFFIHSLAPSNSIVIGSQGNVGLGASTPTAPFHLFKAAQQNAAETLARFNISDDAIGRLDLNNGSSTNGFFIPRLQGRANGNVAALITEGLIASDAGTNPIIVYNAAKNAGGAIVNRPLVTFRNNNVAKVTIAANGNVTATSFVSASSRSLKEDIQTLDSDKASSTLDQLTPVQFIYKDDPTKDPRVGFIAEDVPDLIAEPGRKSVPVMDIVALITKVVKDQQKTIAVQTSNIEKQQRIIRSQESTIFRQQQELARLQDQQRQTQDRLTKLEQLIGK